jgi:hypothetical protein
MTQKQKLLDISYKLKAEDAAVTRSKEAAARNM